MAKTQKFGEARDAEGHVVMEFIGPGRDDDALSVGLRLLTQQLIAKGHGEAGGGFFGGTYGYGANFENDVFLMHRYCWCEGDDCLWCGGSGCQGAGDEPREPHRDGCYQRRLQEFARQYGELLGVYDGREHFYVPYGSPHQERYDAFKRQSCEEMGLDYHNGNEVHCSCGADAEWKQRYKACECDWHKGVGRFRFGAAAYAPHFWHKPSGLKVRWYKYIGRSMEAETDREQSWRDVLADCLRSIGVESLERAAKDYEAAEQQAARDAEEAMKFAFSDEGRKMFDDMFESGVVQVFGGAGDDNDDDV